MTEREIDLVKATVDAWSEDQKRHALIVLQQWEDDKIVAENRANGAKTAGYDEGSEG